MLNSSLHIVFAKKKKKKNAAFQYGKYAFGATLFFKEHNLEVMLCQLYPNFLSDDV